MPALSKVLHAAVGESPAPALPVVKWAGGKRALVPGLRALLPPRWNTYIEPFLGGAAMFLAVCTGPALLGDANRDLIEMYKAIRDEPAAVMSELDRLQPHVLDKDYYYLVRAQQAAQLPAAARAARLIYLNKTCYNGLYRVNRRGQFNVPFGRYPAPPGLYQRDNLLAVSRALSLATLMCADFEECLAGARAGDFVYLDPPYLPLSATANFTKYTVNAFSPAEQQRLANVIHELTDRGCFVLISNSDTPMIRELFSGPRYRIEVMQASRNINSDVRGRNKVSELAIRNYDLE